jgi:hypothetical protein
MGGVEFESGGDQFESLAEFRAPGSRRGEVAPTKYVVKQVPTWSPMATGIAGHVFIIGEGRDRQDSARRGGMA